MITSSFLASLQEIFGNRCLTSDDALKAHGSDYTKMERLPEVVVEPLTADEVSQLMVLANAHKVAVTGRGAGSGATGGALPVLGGVVVSFVKMNRIIDVDPVNLTAVVEPGVITGDLKQTAEDYGLFYGPDPASLKQCTMGGNLAECAGGPSCVKYGVTRDWVLGLEAVLPSGEIIQTGGRTHKCVTGYDLTRLLVGSEGTLALITQATLRLIPKPEARATLLAGFASPEAAAEAATQVLGNGILPSALEFLDTTALDCARKVGTYAFPHDWQAALIVEVDGPREAVGIEARKVEKVLNTADALASETAWTEEQSEGIWEARRAISPALRTLAPGKVNEDIVIPRSTIPGALKDIKALAAKHDLPVVIFGHIGDGNLHVNFMHHQTPAELSRLEGAVAELFHLVLSLGGSLTGEHGIGVTKAAFLEDEIGSASLALHRKLKAAFDPNNILNPGKIFPESATWFTHGALHS